MNKKCLFTGGGSSGHVSVNLALIPIFIENGWDIYYIGSYSGIERRLISQNKDVQYFSIYTGKLRRYFSWQNFFDVFRVVAGVFQAFFIIKRLKPAVIFSKGGFVSFPVVIGGWLNGIPLVMHESDLSPGLANKLSMPFVTKILTTFEETKQYISSNKVQCVGPIIREFLRQGSADEGRAYCGFTKEKPILLIMGGSLGAESINLAVRANLDQLLDCFQIVHLCGRGQADASINVSGYCQFEYIDKELPDVLAMCDMVVSRAGSNAIFEFLTLRKPMVLIPLPSGSSRGDQIMNAQAFKKKGYCEVVPNSDLEIKNHLADVVISTYLKRDFYLRSMSLADTGNSARDIVSIISGASK